MPPACNRRMASTTATETTTTETPTTKGIPTTIAGIPDRMASTTTTQTTTTRTTRAPGRQPGKRVRQREPTGDEPGDPVRPLDPIRGLEPGRLALGPARRDRGRRRLDGVRAPAPQDAGSVEPSFGSPVPGLPGGGLSDF